MSTEDEPGFIKDHLAEIVVGGTVLSMLGAIGAVATHRLRKAQQEAAKDSSSSDDLPEA